MKMEPTCQSLHRSCWQTPKTSSQVLQNIILLHFKWFLLLALCLAPAVIKVAAQPMIQPQYSAQFQQPNNNNYMRNSSAFRQEIARFEITVHRQGKQPLSLSQVPRVQQGDVIKVKLLDEAVNGIKLDQSLFNWTMVVAFINPNRKVSDSSNSSGSSSRQGAVRGKFVNSFAGEDNSGGAVKNNQESSVSQEVNFRKKGWYKEHSFTVPYDSQPILFLYPRPNYRSKILNLINKNSKEIRELGAKTIELAGAYAQISSFLNELQGVISGNSYYAGGYGMGNTGYYGNSIGGYNNSIYNQYNRYNNNQNLNQPFNFNLFLAQAVERMSRGFNINLPNNCWQGSQAFANTSPSYGYNPYNNFNIINQQPTISPELVNRLQCVAKNIRLEDFDLSVSKLLQQGGMLLAVQLQQKYPQLSYWINVAALAIDLIVKIARKSPLRIVPAMSSSSDNPNSGSYGGGYGMPNNSNFTNQNYSSNPNNQNNQPQPMPKISVFAENQPDDNQAVTAYPIVLHKWQAEPDAEVISLRPPVLMEPCLHAGVNVLKSTDLTDDQLNDTFTKDYKLTMTSSNGFKKVFPLRKNLGLNGWELNISPQDLQEFPKIQMTMESTISGTRGFNEIKSPSFFLPISIGGSWQITPESQKDFTVGGKRTISIRNTLGNCQCLQAVIYKPSFGGQFVFESESKDNNRLQFTPDGREVSFEMDAASFQAGAGELELRTYGGESAKLPLKLYGLPPTITSLKINKGDREGIISGDRLEQVQAVRINGRRAAVIGGRGDAETRGQQFQTPGVPAQTYPNQPQRQNSANTYIPNLQASSPNERVIFFEDEKAKLTENSVRIELELEDNRTFQVNQNFPVAPSRPTIIVNENREIEAVAVEGQKSKVESQKSEIKDQKSKVKDQPKLDLSKLPVFPIETNQITFSVQNALTDYDFKVENLSVETRLEKGSSNSNNSGYGNPNQTSYGSNVPLPNVSFEILDWKNLRITMQISEPLQKLLGGRRLQFRIRDKERGDSDWYSISQTFVRVPEIASVVCTNEMNGMCEMKGNSIDYISQVSTDGGQSWYPNGNSTLQVQPTADGQKLAMIPILANKNLMLIKLRDFPRGEGLFFNGFSFLNLVEPIKKVVQPNQPNNQPTPTPNQTQPNFGKKGLKKP